MFRNPSAFILLILIIFYIIFLYKKRLSRERVLFSVSDIYEKLPRTISFYLFRAVHYLPFICLVFIVIALAGPQKGYERRDISSEIRDIIIALDASGSMAAMDFEPNRLERSKEIVKDFIRERPEERIGLIVFSGKAFTHCPLTLDHDTLMKFVDTVDFGMVEDGTAIGNAIAASVSRLRDSDAESKSIVLLTDGENNRGNITPLAAGEMAREFGIKVHTIGVGSEGAVKFPVERRGHSRQYIYAEIGIDRELLKEIADMTGGNYFFADDQDLLAEIFQIIDEEERTLVTATEYQVFVDKSKPFKLTALIILLIYIISRILYFNSLP